MELKTCNILGLDILVTDMEKTVNLIEQNIEQLRGKYICVGNVHTTVMAHDDPQYHTVQADAAFVLPDGGPLSGYSRKHGFPEAERVTGPDLMLALFARDNGGDACSVKRKTGRKISTSSDCRNGVTAVSRVVRSGR